MVDEHSLSEDKTLNGGSRKTEMSFNESSIGILDLDAMQCKSYLVLYRATLS